MYEPRLVGKLRFKRKCLLQKFVNICVDCSIVGFTTIVLESEEIYITCSKSVLSSSNRMDMGVVTPCNHEEPILRNGSCT
jgi:hypothetical protein